MRVVLDRSVFAPAAPCQAALVSIVQFGAEQRHALELDAGAEDALQDWLRGLSPAMCDEVELALSFGAQHLARNPTDNSIVVTSSAESDWEASPPRLPVLVARELLSRPLGILVENAHNDGMFVKAVCPGIFRASFLELLRAGWIEFRQGGGLTEIHNALLRDGGSPEMARRTVVVFDADALAPGKPSKKALAVEACCAGVFRFHRLQRRAAENYLPPRVLEEAVSADKRDAALAMLRRMGPEGRAHFNMKKGFHGDQNRPDGNDTATRAHIDSMYNGLKLKDKARLHRGFGERVRDVFGRDELLTQARFAEDGQVQEMNQLLNCILRWV